jgi:hypothetical protein
VKRCGSAIETIALSLYQSCHLETGSRILACQDPGSKTGDMHLHNALSEISFSKRTPHPSLFCLYRLEIHTCPDFSPCTIGDCVGKPCSALSSLTIHTIEQDGRAPRSVEQKCIRLCWVWKEPNLSAKDSKLLCARFARECGDSDPEVIAHSRTIHTSTCMSHSSTYTLVFERPAPESSGLVLG